MPLFLVERTFAEAAELTSAQARALMEINADAGVSWLFSFLRADRKKTYCLYEAPSADLIYAAARRAGLPIDAVVEVTQQRPEWFVER